MVCDPYFVSASRDIWVAKVLLVARLVLVS